MTKLSDKEVRQTVQDLQKESYGKPDSRENFSRAGHQARNDAVGTAFEVRGKKNDVVSVEKEREQQQKEQSQKDKSGKKR